MRYKAATLFLLAVLIAAFAPSSEGKRPDFCQLVVILDEPQLSGENIGEEWVLDVFLRYNGDVDVANIVDYLESECECDWFFVIPSFPAVLFNTYIRNGDEFELAVVAREEDEGGDDEGTASTTLTATCGEGPIYAAHKVTFSLEIQETLGPEAGKVAKWDLELRVALLPPRPEP